jgi:hypothetical protein
MFVIPRNVTRWNVYVARALLQVGRRDEAQRMVCAALEDDAEGCGDLAAAAAAEAHALGEDPEWILPLVIADSSGLVIDQLARILKPVITAHVCLAALQGGAGHPWLFTTLVTAALVAGASNLAHAALEHSRLGDPATLEKLAGLARRKGEDLIAERLLAAA